MVTYNLRLGQNVGHRPNILLQPTLSKFSGCRISLAKLGTTAWPPKPAKTNPIPPSQFEAVNSGPKLVFAGWMIEPGAEVLMKPSRRTVRTRRKVDTVESSDGRESRWSGRSVVGSTLALAIARYASAGTYITRPSSFQVFDEVDGKRTSSVSPNSTIKATLGVSSTA